MGATHTINLGKANKQDIRRGTEAVTADANEFILILDEDDRLYCNGVTDEPSAWLVQSVRNGWKKGETIACVNRGKPGGALILVVADGRSRVKATRIVNEERVRDGLAPIRPEFVLVTEDEGYALMHMSANKQERKPLFEARCWAHHKRMFAKKIGASSLSDSETRDARKEYSELRKCTTSQMKAWDLILSAHPEVLRMFDAGERGLNRAALLEIVGAKAYADQPEAARKVIELAKRKDAPVEAKAEEIAQPNDVVMKTHFDPTDTPAVTAEPTKEKTSRGTRSERTDRREALGIETTKTVSTKRLSALSIELRKIDKPELVDPRVFLAMIMGQVEFDGIPIEAHPSMQEVIRSAKRVGIKVAK
jgi:hypothetical protein